MMGSRGGTSLKSIIFSVILVGLLSLSLTGTAAAILINLKLSGDLETGGEVRDFDVTPDGHFVVFLADARTDGVDELFSVPTNGGEPTRLSQDLPAGMLVDGFILSPDSQSVLYWIYDESGFCRGVYAVPTPGGAPVDLHGTVPASERLWYYEISADSQYAIYILNHEEEGGDPYDTLWAAPMSEGGPIALTPEVCENDCIFELMSRPSGMEVVYVLAQGGDRKLYRTDMQGISEQLAGDSVIDFAITPDGDRVVYTNAVDSPNFELFSVPMEGGTPIRLSGTMASGRNVDDFKIAPNSQVVVYRADEIEHEQWELFSAPVNGSTERIRLLSTMIPNGDVEQYEITPNSLGVVYMADQLVDERLDLGAVAINGGTNFWLNKEMVEGGNVTRFGITPNSLGVVFIADKYVDETFELFSVSVLGTLLGRLSTDLPAGGEVRSFIIAPNSQGVVYRADQDADDVFELYAVPTVGGIPPVKINAPLVTGGNVSWYAITPDSRGVIYLADQDTDEVNEIFATFDRMLTYLPLAMR